MNTTCPTSDLCTLQTCPLECGQVTFLPSLPGNLLYAILFGLILLAQIGLGVWYKTWGFMVGMFCGLALEVIGYIGRIMLHHNPFDFNNFLIYLIPLTIGPAFLSGSIYLCLARIIVTYGSQISRLKPRTYAIFFMCSDFLSLVLQAAGGAIAAIANTPSLGNTGRYVMIAGLVLQVVSLGAFLALWLDFLLALRKVREDLRGRRFAVVRAGRNFKAFNYALWLATILILIRSVYRVVELQGGFSGTVASNEAAFMVLEGPMIILATFALTVFHPGIAYEGNWRAAAWSLRGKTTDFEMVDTKENMVKRDEE